MKELGMDINNWEELATDRSKWRSNLHAALKLGEERIATAADDRRKRRKETLCTANRNTVTIFKCDFCDKYCQSRIGLFSHQLLRKDKWSRSMIIR